MWTTLNSTEPAWCQTPPLSPKLTAGWGNTTPTARTHPADLCRDIWKAGGSSGSQRGARGLWWRKRRRRRKRRSTTSRCWGRWPTRQNRRTPGRDSARGRRTTATPPTPNPARATWSPAWNDATPTSWGATRLSAGATGLTSSAEACSPPDGGATLNKLHCVSRKRTTVALCTFIFLDES